MTKKLENVYICNQHFKGLLRSQLQIGNVGYEDKKEE